MSQTDFATLCQRGKLNSGFDSEDEKLLIQEGGRLLPYLAEVTEKFYDELQQIPAAVPYLEGRVEGLKATHLAWLQTIFSGPYDANFAASMHKVGEVHVQVKLPVEFMASGTLLIKKHLVPILTQVYAGDALRMGLMMKAVNGVTGFCLIIMQESYQSSLLAQELDKFMAITGISRALFNNLANAYKDDGGAGMV
ncbi:protoglobin domain-containing protein [Marinobacterium iners]|uniref:Protoglobin n=1 Tax=Marinobacterium iners DSM 11526 TaxID=1122198 RepID=A0A1H4GZE6_9GAMM|nr:protoglobin domain-containing protein [Marinobacterium iners]SEB14268.1 Protoglobin [Marinobacterium iners DSM 11526]